MQTATRSKSSKTITTKKPITLLSRTEIYDILESWDACSPGLSRLAASDGTSRQVLKQYRTRYDNFRANRSLHRDLDYPFAKNFEWISYQIGLHAGTKDARRFKQLFKAAKIAPANGYEF